MEEYITRVLAVRGCKYRTQIEKWLYKPRILSWCTNTHKHSGTRKLEFDWTITQNGELLWQESDAKGTSDARQFILDILNTLRIEITAAQSRSGVFSVEILLGFLMQIAPAKFRIWLGLAKETQAKKVYYSFRASNFSSSAPVELTLRMWKIHANSHSSLLSPWCSMNNLALQDFPISGLFARYEKIEIFPRVFSLHLLLCEISEWIIEDLEIGRGEAESDI